MPNKDTTPLSLYGNDREYLREQEKTNELLADIAGEEYESPGDIPNGKYVIQKRLLDAAQKKNELLETIASESGGGEQVAKAIGIDYATDIISLKNKDGDVISGSGATLPAYGVSFDPTTGGLTLTKNGTAVQGQTVTIPNYGSPVGVTDSADMVDEGTIYLYEGTTGGGFTNGHFYYYDGSAWADGGEYAAATVQTDKTLLVEDRAADAKATGEAVDELKTQFDELSAFVNVTSQAGYLIKASDGAYVASEPYTSFEYPVYGLSSLKLTPNFTNATYGYAFYDKGKVFLTDSGNVYESADEITVAVPDGAFYIRFSSANANPAIIKADIGLLLETKADAYAINERVTGLSESISTQGDYITNISAFYSPTKNSGKLVRASDGALISSAPYNAYEYPVYGLTNVYITPYFTNDTYGYAFYDADHKFIQNSGGVYSEATKTNVQVPTGAYYIMCTENTAVTNPLLVEADWGTLLVTKAAIKPTVDNSAEMYEDVYAKVQYASDQELAVPGKYYDTSGNLQTSGSFSTSGIVRVPYGAKDVNYYAYKIMSVPTMIFFDGSMNIVGTVVATEAAVYGDLFYSGHATIPATAKYYEVSFNSTAGQTVVLRYSKPDNNNERITILETDPLFGKKLTCTGDSITAATHSYPGHSYVDQIAQAHGMSVNNKAIWGAVFAQNQVDGQGNARGCIYDTIALMDADADIVVISGGINDLEYYARAEYWGSITPTYEDTLDTETFCGALEGICKTALQKWSGKPIIFVFEHRMTIDTTTYGSFFKNTEYALMIQIFQKWGIPYVDLYHDMPSLALNAGYKEAYTTGDGTHPNIAGYAKFYVPRVYSKIKEVMGI